MQDPTKLASAIHSPFGRVLCNRSHTRSSRHPPTFQLPARAQIGSRPARNRKVKGGRRQRSPRWRRRIVTAESECRNDSDRSPVTLQNLDRNMPHRSCRDIRDHSSVRGSGGQQHCPCAKRDCSFRRLTVYGHDVGSADREIEVSRRLAAHDVWIGGPLCQVRNIQIVLHLVLDVDLQDGSRRDLRQT